MAECLYEIMNCKLKSLGLDCVIIHGRPSQPQMNQLRCRAHPKIVDEKR